jgi:DNA-binding NtrC family response regulator
MTQEANQSKANTIVLVEDDEDIRELLLRTITMETEYEVVAMRSDGEMIERLPEVRALKPVLFLLDYRLPTMTGLDLYDLLHTQRDLESVPAIIMTAFRFKKDVVRKLHERDVTMLEKPFDLEDFLCYIEQTLLSQRTVVTDIRALLHGQEQ